LSLLRRRLLRLAPLGAFALSASALWVLVEHASAPDDDVLEPAASVLVGGSVPAFTLPPLTDGPGLGAQDFAAASGPVLLNFFASWCTPCLQGIKKIGEGMALGEGMQTFAAWFYPTHLTVEFDPGEEPDDAAVLAGLKPYRHTHTEDFTQYEFANRMDPVFELWRRSGYWEMAHPWTETTLPWESAGEFIESVLAQTPPQALGPGGHILLWPAYTRTSDVPLFMHPEGDYVMGWGILPGVPFRFLDRALAQLDMVSELSIMYGGKRYLSGYITFDTAEKWAQHFGDRWPMILEAKRKFDPDGIMAPGFIQYE